MSEDNNRYESVYSSKVRAGKRRTYFFDVKQTKGGDYYLTLTESTRKFNEDGYERHKIFLYKEDFNRFQNSLNDAINHVKTDLMPDFEYDLYEKRQAEWEAQQKAEAAAAEANPNATETGAETTSETTTETSAESTTADPEIEEDISW